MSICNTIASGAEEDGLLRVGDVIEEEPHSLREILNDKSTVFNQTGSRYVRRLAWFRSFDVARMNVSRAVIVAGSHLPYASFNRSCMYVHEVRKEEHAEQDKRSMVGGRDGLDLTPQHLLEIESRTAANADYPAPARDDDHYQERRAYGGILPAQLGEDGPRARRVDFARGDVEEEEQQKRE